MTLEARSAIEALRAGVPNRAAIRQLGTEQTTIEHAFEAALSAAWAEAVPARGGTGAGGIGMAGGFGTGKSHLLGYLAEVARQQGFVVSRIVVSKETPLSHAGHILAAALRDAALPVFAACLFLVRRGATPPETLRRIAHLWSGAKASIPAIRKALVAAGAGRTFSLKAIPAAALTEQLLRFVPLLFRAVGYAGWCILLDEVELIGRYTPLQRAQAYAVLAAWLGLDGKRRYPGIVVAYAITDDFVTAVINARQDSEKLPERLELKGRSAEAALTLPAIRHIERTVLQNRLLPPTLNDLAVCHDKVQQLYGAAYQWPAPPLPQMERTSSRTLRQYIKGWITQWDLRRLGRGDAPLVADGIASNYSEDATLAEPHPLDDEDA